MSAEPTRALPPGDITVGNGLDRSVVKDQTSALNLGSVKTEPYGTMSV